MLKSYIENNFDYYSILQSLGYDLKDCGAYWQCEALYRGGDNRTALQIWKDDGRVVDYVRGESFPFQQLVGRTTNCSRKTSEILKRGRIEEFDLGLKKKFI